MREDRADPIQPHLHARIEIRSPERDRADDDASEQHDYDAWQIQPTGSLIEEGHDSERGRNPHHEDVARVERRQAARLDERHRPENECGEQSTKRDEDAAPALHAEHVIKGGRAAIPPGKPSLLGIYGRIYQPCREHAYRHRLLFALELEEAR